MFIEKSGQVLEPSLCMGKRGSTYAPVGTRERSNKEVVDGDERS